MISHIRYLIFEVLTPSSHYFLVWDFEYYLVKRFDKFVVFVDEGESNVWVTFYEMEKVYVKRDIYDGILGLLKYWLNDWRNKGASCVEEVFDLGLERIGNLHKSHKYAGKKLN